MVAQDSSVAADYATRTSVALLDALIDSMTLARPGHDASRFAADLRRLGDGAAHASHELVTLLDSAREPAVEDSVIEVPLPVRRARVA